MSIVRVGTIKLGVLRVLVTLLVAFASIAMADEVRVTMDDVIAQWTLREEQAQNVHIEWSETIAIPAEFGLVHDHVANTYIRVPDRDVSIPVSYSLLLAGEMARYDSACDFWDEAYNGIISRFHSDLTFVHLFAFAILAASMTEYKTEIGLWMLALLFAGCWSGLIAMYTFGQIIDLRRGVALNGTVAIDAFF